MKTLSYRQIMALVSEISITESNGNNRILTGSWEIEVYVHAQYRFRQK